jgi:SAM-dependent methyltransferase
MKSQLTSLRERLVYYKSVLNKDMARQAEIDYKTFKTARDVLCTYQEDLRSKAILDIGCGRLCSLTLLFHSLASKVTGIDIVYIGINDPFHLKFWRSLTKSGLEGFGRDMLYIMLGKNKAYIQQLRNLSGFELDPKFLDIKQMSVESMSFANDIFDIAISNNVFEHVADVPRAVSELHRVLKKGAIIYINIDLFTGLCGGHHPQWNHSRRIPPWDHLRANTHAVPVFLNKLRKSEYISLFKQKFEVLEVIDGKSLGKDLLTASIRAELSRYSEEELLKGNVTIIGRK